MKMKKFLAAFLALTMVVLCFAACGKGDNGGTAGEKTLKIGLSGPLTGDAAQYGNGVKNGAQLAVDEINAAGGVNGIKLDFKMEDDEADSEKAKNAYGALKDWGMQISLGTVTSGACIAFQGEASKDNMFVLTPSATAVEAINGANAFRVCFADPQQGVESADYIAKNALATKVAVIYDSSDAYSSGIYDAFVAEAKAKGLDVKSSGAELLFLPIYYKEATLILQTAKKAALDIKYFGCDGLDGILTMENFDASLAENVMLLTPFAKNATDEFTVNFVTKYKEAYGESTMNQFAADAYDAIYILKTAIEKANITADMTSSQICDALKAVMTEINYTGVTAKGMTWGADGEPSKPPIVVKVENGAYTIL